MSTKKLSEFVDLLNIFELKVAKADLKQSQKAKTALINFAARLMQEAERADDERPEDFERKADQARGDMGT